MIFLKCQKDIEGQSEIVKMIKDCKNPASYKNDGIVVCGSVVERLNGCC